MDLYNSVMYMSSIYIIVLLLGVYIDWCSLNGKKSLIWPSIQKEIENYRNYRLVLKARLFIKITLILILLDMAYVYSLHRDLRFDKSLWILVIFIFIGSIYESVISYKNDIRGKWTRIYKHIILFLAIMLGMIWKLLFDN